MFHVLVLGGIALVGGACSAEVATPKAWRDASPDDGGVADAPAEADVSFPLELPAVFDSGATTDAGAGVDAGFPVEAP
jgi:hypothetical protein